MERKLEVEFTDEEKKEYKALDDAAREFYVGFKASKGHELSKHFLLLSQKLTPLRIAASGGQIPLDDEEENDEPEETEDEPSDDEAETRRRRRRDARRYYSPISCTGANWKLCWSNSSGHETMTRKVRTIRRLNVSHS